MPVRLETRDTQPAWLRIAVPLLAVGMTLVVGATLFAVLGHDPARALAVFLVDPLLSRYGLADLAIKAAPLLLCALGLAVGFRGNVWNIGAEGQLVMGAIAGGAVALAFHGASASAWVVLPLVLVAGVLGGAGWATVPAWLRTRFNANEILTSLMLTYVAMLLLGYLVHGPLRSPAGFNFPVSRDFPPSAILPELPSHSGIHLGVLLALLAVPAMWLLMERSFAGFRVTVAGLAPRAAAYAGYGTRSVVWIGLLAGGAVAGLAGVAEVTGPIGKLQAAISPGYGFAAIIVAFLGRLHAFGILLASLLMALLYVGGDAAQIHLNLSPAVTGVFQGMLLFFLLGSEFLLRYRVRFARRKVRP